MKIDHRDGVIKKKLRHEARIIFYKGHIQPLLDYDSTIRVNPVSKVSYDCLQITCPHWFIINTLVSCQMFTSYYSDYACTFIGELPLLL